MKGSSYSLVKKICLQTFCFVSLFLFSFSLSQARSGNCFDPTTGTLYIFHAPAPDESNYAEFGAKDYTANFVNFFDDEDIDEDFTNDVKLASITESKNYALSKKFKVNFNEFNILNISKDVKRIVIDKHLDHIHKDFFKYFPNLEEVFVMGCCLNNLDLSENGKLKFFKIFGNLLGEVKKSSNSSPNIIVFGVKSNKEDDSIKEQGKVMPYNFPYAKNWNCVDYDKRSEYFKNWHPDFKNFDGFQIFDRPSKYLSIVISNASAVLSTKAEDKCKKSLNFTSLSRYPEIKKSPKVYVVNFYEIWPFTFENSKMEEVYLKNNKKNGKMSVEPMSFINCFNLKTVHMDTNTKILPNAFEGCYSLANFIISLNDNDNILDAEKTGREILEMLDREGNMKCDVEFRSMGSKKTKGGLSLCNSKIYEK